MLTLTLPGASRHDDWKAMLDDFGATPKDGSGFAPGDAPDTSREDFDAYLADRARQGDVSVKPEPGKVHCTYFWILDDDGVAPGEPARLVGFLALRHVLNELLLQAIGHIGYSVRPSARGRGIAQGALKLGLDRARERGIEQVLVTCSVTNDASRAVTERCGGQFDDVRTSAIFPDGSRRYRFGTPPWPNSPVA